MEIKVDLTVRSIEDGIKKIKELKRLFGVIEKEFMIESLHHIRDKANSYLDERVYAFPNSANVKDYWVIESSGLNKWTLRNTYEISTLIEFGTGIAGQQNPHKQADDANYEYDVNNHGSKGWSFKFYYDGVEYDYKNYTGFKGKSFLYDAFYDYFYHKEYITIYKRVYSKYIQ